MSRYSHKVALVKAAHEQRYSHRISLIKPDYSKFEDKISSPGEDRSGNSIFFTGLLVVVLILCAVAW